MRRWASSVEAAKENGSTKLKDGAAIFTDRPYFFIGFSNGRLRFYIFDLSSFHLQRDNANILR